MSNSNSNIKNLSDYHQSLDGVITCKCGYYFSKHEVSVCKCIKCGIKTIKCKRCGGYIEIKDDKKKDKLLISIVGPIAPGKSTFCKNLKQLNSDTIGIYTENISGYNELVEAYYKDPKTYTAPFQIFMINRKLINIYDATHSPYKINIVERFLTDNRDIFAFNRYENGFSDDKSWQEYNKFYNIVEAVTSKPDFYIYLTGKPEFLLERIHKQRKRAGEEMITLSYMQDIDVLYNKWVDKKREEGCYIYRIDVDRDLTPEEINTHFWKAMEEYKKRNV